jgi:hypothetical protein
MEQGNTLCPQPYFGGGIKISELALFNITDTGVTFPLYLNNKM